MSKVIGFFAYAIPAFLLALTVAAWVASNGQMLELRGTIAIGIVAVLVMFLTLD